MSASSKNSTIAILMPGDMGHGVGRALIEHGHRVVTCLAGRSQRSHDLAAAAGIEDLQGLSDVVTTADVILSILPPAAAVTQAEAVAGAMSVTDSLPVYVDCNAVSPDTVREAAAVIADAGAPFIDAGIIGLAPGMGTATRFYVSGPDTSAMEALNGKGFEVIPLGDEIGRASAMKMCYAALTKGTWTLQTAVLMAAERQGLYDEVVAEFSASQQATLAAMEKRIPRLPADAGRWVGEMEEIAKTFRAAGVSGDFHDGAADVFRILDRTPFAAETRQDWDTSRTIADAVPVFARYVDDTDSEDKT